jgi:hypothetical protein
MREPDAWEHATIDLIHQLEARSPSPDAHLDALHIALKVYRQEHGLRVDDVLEPTPDQIAAYSGLGAKDVLKRWAAEHGDLIAMKDLSRFIVAAGLVRDMTQAAGFLYPAMTRSPQFQRVAHGLYRLTATSAFVCETRPRSEPLPAGAQKYIRDVPTIATVVHKGVAIEDSGIF